MSLSIPELDEDTDTLTAALAYAKAGWYLVPANQTKHPGSVVGNKWQYQSSRDPAQLAAWFAGTNHAICLHVGRSGGLAFDVDTPGSLTTLLRGEFARASPPFQSTRDNDPERGHYLFAMPAGRHIGNSNGDLGRDWGEVRGLNGVVVVQPSRHDAEHGRYLWQRTGVCPELDPAVAGMLRDASDATDAASDADLLTFFTAHRAASEPGLFRAIREKFRKEAVRGSRHNAALTAMCWAMREASAGVFAAKSAEAVLHAEFTAAIGGERRIVSEWAGIRAWAVGQARLADPKATLSGVAERTGEGAMSDSGEEVFTDKEKRRLQAIPASTVVLRKVRWLWHDRIPIGEITLVAGREGVGKSTYLADLAAKVTRGTAIGEYQGLPRSVIYLASEDSWAYTIAPRMVAAGANLDRVFWVEPVEIEAGGTAVLLPRDCRELAELALNLDAAAIMCDPIMSLIPGEISTDRAHDLRLALEPLRRAAEKSRCAVTALVHFNKRDGDVLTKIAGSRGWAEVARAAIGLARDPDNDHNVLSQIKNNLGRLDLSHHAYHIVGTAVATADGPSTVGRIEWLGKVEEGVEEIMERKADTRGKDRSTTTNAIIDFVQTNNQVSVQDVLTAFPDVADAVARRALATAAGSGEIRHVARGIYGAVPRG